MIYTKMTVKAFTCLLSSGRIRWVDKKYYIIALRILLNNTQPVVLTENNPISNEF